MADVLDYSLVFPYEAWMRGACRDAMGCKIGHRLLVRCIKLMLVDHGLTKVEDPKAYYAENK